MSNPQEKLYFGISKTQHLIHLLMLVVWLVLISEPTWIMFPKFFKALGEAGLIAVLVIYLVEAQSHKRLEETALKMISQVGRGIFGIVYGHELPDKLVKALEENTLKQPVYRDHMYLNYELAAKTLTVNGKEIQLSELTSLHRFNLVNCSDKPQSLPISIYLERDKWLTTQSGAEAKDTEPSIFFVQIGKDIYFDLQNRAAIQKMRGTETLDDTLSQKDIKPHLSQTDAGSKLTFLVPSIEIPAKGRMEICYGGVLHKRHSDNEFWTTKYPTQAVTLSITSSDYEINVDFPDSTEPMHESAGKINRQWVYNDVMLKGHSVIFWWIPKENA